MSKTLYRIDKEDIRVGKIIDSDLRIVKSRYEKYKRFKPFFDELLSFSYLSIPISSLLTWICNPHIGDIIFKNGELSNIRRILRKTGFSQNDNCYFIDYLLEAVRQEVEKKENLLLPSRFSSCFFFENEEDCVSFRNEFPNCSNLNIIEVRTVLTRSIGRFDNRMLANDFSLFSISFSCDMIEAYLKGKSSSYPRYEVLFQGTYEIVSCKRI